MTSSAELEARLPATAIRYVRAQLDARESNWLKDRGWKYSCATPGFYWMWTREWEGKTFLVDQKTASRIQSGWDTTEDNRLHPLDYEDS